MEIQIGQDIRKYKTKDIGNFSFKEAGFLAIGAAIGFVIFKITNSFEATILPVGVILVFGFFKPYGMSCWAFMRTVLKENITTQCYINETDFEYNSETMKELYGDDCVIPAEWDVIQTTTPAKINKEDRERLAS